MNPRPSFCEQCGAPLGRDLRFCEQCGAPVRPAFDAPPRTPATGSRRGVGCLLGLAALVALAAVAASAYLLLRPVADEAHAGWPIAAAATSTTLPTTAPTLTPLPSATPEPTATATATLQPSATPEPIATATATPLPTATATEAPTSTSAPVPGAGQSRSDRDIWDDFSAETFSWCVAADDIAISGYEDGAYFMHALQPLYRTLCFVPVTFYPNTAEFDAWVPEDYRGGTFGLLCHYHSQDDFYSVEIDLDSQSLYVRQKAGDESYPLTDPEWIDLSYLKPEASAANHVMVACDPDMIIVWINYNLEAQVSLDYLVEPGDMALFVKGWDSMGPDGYKVLFDNFVAWKPVQ